MKAEPTPAVPTTAAVPPVIRAAWVNRSADEAFRVFTDEIGAWWPLPTHGLFGGRSGSVVFRDGLLVEESVDGRVVVWGEVIAWEPHVRLVIAWHPGREAAEASEVEIVFEPHGDGTRVVIEHRGWQVFGDDAVNRRLGYVGPNAWGYVLDHYADCAEPHPDAVDVQALAQAYDEFFAEAERGGFGAAPAGEWNAEQVVAHVALNDAAMLGVCQALVHGNETRFENEVCQDLDVLARFIAEAGDMSGLIDRGRTLSRSVLASLRRLSSEQLEHQVHCCLRHDGNIMVDGPMRWAGVAVETQAATHLPAHIGQLRDLRVQVIYDPSMADRTTIDATLQRYYDAWVGRDHDLYRSVWADDAAFADPPTDGEVPPTGFDQILAGMEEVWSRAESINYDRHRVWHCGHSVAVHSTVIMKLSDALAHIPLIHVFRFDDDGLIRRLEAFLDFEQVEMVEGERPVWMNATG